MKNSNKFIDFFLFTCRTICVHARVRAHVLLLTHAEMQMCLISLCAVPLNLVFGSNSHKGSGKEARNGKSESGRKSVNKNQCFQ